MFVRIQSDRDSNIREQIPGSDKNISPDIPLIYQNLIIFCNFAIGTILFVTDALSISHTIALLL